VVSGEESEKEKGNIRTATLRSEMSASSWAICRRGVLVLAFEAIV
jgi:hypothetical protein